MKNETQSNNQKLTNFKFTLQYAIEKYEGMLTELSETNLSEYSISWKAKDFIVSQEKVRNFNSIAFQLEEVNVTDDEQLSRFLVGILGRFISLAQSYRHNSTCPWNNAINFARNEATLEAMDFIQKYI